MRRAKAVPPRPAEASSSSSSTRAATMPRSPARRRSWRRPQPTRRFAAWPSRRTSERALVARAGRDQRPAQRGQLRSAGSSTAPDSRPTTFRVSSLVHRKAERMNSDELRALQAPLKARYKDEPAAALVTLKASGRLGDERIACSVETGKALAEAGLHPASGGDGLLLCSGDMLLEALVACAGVTLKAVATAIGIPIRAGTVRAEGDLDFRGTLGVNKEAPVGFAAIRLDFDLDRSEERRV